MDSKNNIPIEWEIDKSHTKIGFSVSHMVISSVDGFFKSYDGTVKMKGDDFQNADVELSIDAASINTENQQRDEHLRSEDFFQANSYPKILFKSKSFQKTSENKYKLTGDLTIRDVTKEVDLDVKYNGTVKDPWGNTKAGFKIRGELNRFDFNLKWNQLLETGGLMVGQTVELEMDIELTKKS